MSSLRLFIVCLLLLWLAAILQQSVATRAEVFGQRPDFLLATFVSLGLCVPGNGPIWVGFAAGVLQGGVSGANIVHYVISRTVCGYGLVLFRSLDLDMNLLIAAISTFMATLLSQFLLMFLAPPPAIPPFLADTISTAMYNGVLALPTYAVVRKLLRSRPGV